MIEDPPNPEDYTAMIPRAGEWVGECVREDAATKVSNVPRFLSSALPMLLRIVASGPGCDREFAASLTRSQNPKAQPSRSEMEARLTASQIERASRKSP